jgi:hypothetical protein
MDAGWYANLFEVQFDDISIPAMRAERAKSKELDTLKKHLRTERLDAWVYTTKEDIVGYGSDADKLRDFGFVPTSVNLHSVPELASRMVIDGFVKHLEQSGYKSQTKKGRTTVFNHAKPVHMIANGPRLLRGYDLRSLFLWDAEADVLVFALLVDTTFAYVGADDTRLNTNTLVTQYGNDALREFRQKQGDLLPNRKINLEISRQRLLEQILPFVSEHRSFSLPCGVEAHLSTEPMRIVRAEEEG